MGRKKELIGVKLFDPNEKLTKQVKIALPKNYIKSIDWIANELNVKKKYLIWDAIGNYIQICRKTSTLNKEILK